MTDAFTFVLHGHLPYARGAGRWPHGEEWLHEVVLGTYLPLLVTLHDLRGEGVPFRLTLGLTPILIEQLGDADIGARFVEYADERVHRAEEDVRRFADLDDYPRETLAAHYLERYRALLVAYRRRFGRDLLAAFRDLARSGHIELLTGAATHAYLPLLERPGCIRSQLRTGAASTRRLLGVDPRGVWLPECAYAAGLERYLEEEGLTHFVADAALLPGAPFAEAAASAGAADSAAFSGWPSGASSGWASSWASGVGSAEAGEWGTPALRADVLRHYRVGTSDVVALLRHPRISAQVWSAWHGYPGDPAYREFHKRDGTSGLRYWRVTDRAGDLGDKQLYDRDAAHARVLTHAAHFIELVRAELAAHQGGPSELGGAKRLASPQGSERIARRRRDIEQAERGDGTASAEPALLVAAFDLELFGHWWFEGVDWLAEVLRRAAREGPPSATAAGWLGEAAPRRRIALREGSWGLGNDHRTWLNEHTADLWRELGEAARRMEALADEDFVEERAARQAARELLLAQASDWPFLMTTGQAAEYARERFRAHLLRFHRAAVLATSHNGSRDRELATLEAMDNPFPDVEWRVFAGRLPISV